MLAAALDGIDNKMQPPKPLNNVNVYELSKQERMAMGVQELPGSLEEAITEMEKDAVVKVALGQVAYETFRRAKLEEWDQYRIGVTDWEVKRYLETD
jgi:glutamine synthetase